jgi:hypothetical protein
LRIGIIGGSCASRHQQIINPYLNLTAEDDFIGNGRLIQFNASSTPLIVNNWNIPNNASRDVYGRVTAGVVAPVWNNISFTADVSRSFAREGAMISTAQAG